MKTGIELIAEERQRQMEVEGWTPQHDDKHMDGELADAGACYAMADYARQTTSEVIALAWPWDKEWWKPSPEDRVRELAKAGALIAAEIDRLNRKK